MIDSVRVVDLGNGTWVERKARLDERQHAWVYAAMRHLEWLQARLAR